MCDQIICEDEYISLTQEKQRRTYTRMYVRTHSRWSDGGVWVSEQLEPIVSRPAYTCIGQCSNNGYPMP